MRDIFSKCKGCGKIMRGYTSWCRDCYYEFHESKEELEREECDDNEGDEE